MIFVYDPAIRRLALRIAEVARRKRFAPIDGLSNPKSLVIDASIGRVGPDWNSIRLWFSPVPTIQMAEGKGNACNG